MAAVVSRGGRPDLAGEARSGVEEAATSVSIPVWPGSGRLEVLTPQNLYKCVTFLQGQDRPRVSGA